MATKDSLGDRMKSYYEDRYRISLPRRTNIVIRIDGKAFHTYTRGLPRPFSPGLADDMDATTKFLCENIQGAKMGYVQSDEISIVLHDYNDLSTDGWFDFNLQKMCSIASSLATAKFNQLRMARSCWEGSDIAGSLDQDGIEKFKLAMFDARVFVIPEAEEVVNYFLWRQQDATRNSISMAAQSMFSHRELQGKSSDEMQEMMFTLKGTNWDDYPTRFKRGAAIVKVEEHILAKDFKFKKDGKTHPIDPDKIITRRAWTPVETPIFSRNRNFVLDILKPEEK
jgi:tRNA(His) guanylyltransferase